MSPIEKRNFGRQIADLQKAGINSPITAQRAVFAILALWQSNCFPELEQKERYGTKKYLRDPKIQALAKWIAKSPFLEATFWLSSAYALLIGKESQSHFAMYFTPPSLANRLIDNLLNQGASLSEAVWMDPACGGGAFLTPVAIRMAEALDAAGATPRQIVETVARNLAGNDIDPVLAELSKNFIRMALYREITLSGLDPELSIIVGDSLMPQSLDRSADVIVCNPPYRKMKKEEVDRYRDQFLDVIEGQPNIYGLFIRQCINLVGEDALIGLLTPTSYLSGQYFSKLRQRLLSDSYLCQIDLVREKEGVFIGVEQETALSIFRKVPTLGGENTTDVFMLSKHGEFENIGNCTLPGNGAAWPLPRELGDALILSGAGASPYRLKDYGYTARTGAYVDYRDDRKTYTKRPNNKRMKAVFPLIWSSDITTNGKLIHGRTSKQDKHHTFIEMTDPGHQSIVRNPCLALQRITSADQDRRLIGAEISEQLLAEFGGVMGENHVLFLERLSEDALFTPAQLGAILGTRPVDRLFRCISGAVNVSIFELEQLPLPNPWRLSSLLKLPGISVDDAVYLAFVATPVRADNQTVNAQANFSEYLSLHTEPHSIGYGTTLQSAPYTLRVGDIPQD